MQVNALDPELPSLAASAAVELDLLIVGEVTRLDAVQQLGARLQKSLVNPTEGQPARRLQVDTETETILGQAFTLSGDDPTTILNELVRRTEQLSKQLANANSGTVKADLEKQRAFCLALSQSAAAYRQMIFDVRPPHPYRR